MGMKLAGVMAFLMLVAGGIFYWYYNDTQERMAILNENNAKLEVAVQINEEAVKQLQVDHKRANEQLGKVNDEFADIRRQNQVLADKLSNHDIGNLAQNKPSLVEKIINNATEKANRCFELVSGAKLTDKEKEAKDGKSFNSECPWLFDRYKSN
jgi:predicted nuclease with TOPRIM domain